MGGLQIALDAAFMVMVTNAAVVTTMEWALLLPIQPMVRTPMARMAKASKGQGSTEVTPLTQ